MVYWIIGLSGAGKTTLATKLYKTLKPEYPNTVLIDGDVIRNVFQHETMRDNLDPYSLEGRRINADRICELCRWLNDQSIHVVCAVLSVFEESRQWNRKHISDYFEIYLEANIQFLKKHRDYKGLYRSAQSDISQNIVGCDIPFIPPKKPDLVIQSEDINGVDLQGVCNEILDVSNFAPSATSNEYAR
ncbi:MAG: adenylyl-sulfate kinase [Verrucomicrobiota bacterium]